MSRFLLLLVEVILNGCDGCLDLDRCNRRQRCQRYRESESLETRGLVAGPGTALSPPVESTSSLQALGESLPWRPNSWGEWSFTTSLDGSTIAVLRPLLEAISRSPARKLVLGRFEYSLSYNPKFINRKAA
jgi:hypothetical protein